MGEVRETYSERVVAALNGGGAALASGFVASDELGRGGREDGESESDESGEVGEHLGGFRLLLRMHSVANAEDLHNTARRFYNIQVAVLDTSYRVST